MRFVLHYGVISVSRPLGFLSFFPSLGQPLFSYISYIYMDIYTDTKKGLADVSAAGATSKHKYNIYIYICISYTHNNTHAQHSELSCPARDDGRNGQLGSSAPQHFRALTQRVYIYYTYTIYLNMYRALSWYMRIIYVYPFTSRLGRESSPLQGDDAFTSRLGKTRRRQRRQRRRPPSAEPRSRESANEIAQEPPRNKICILHV